MASKFPNVTFKPVEGRIPSVTAAFDPQTLVITKPVLWAREASSRGDRPTLEFSHALGRRLSLTLHLESSQLAASVQPDLDLLMRLATVIDPTGAEATKRPPMIELVWPTKDSLPEFKGVFDRIEVHYLEILTDGTPRKAHVVVETEEASRLSFTK